MLSTIQLFGFSLVYVALDALGEKFCLHCSKLKKYANQITSGAAGFTLAYLFLKLFPETFTGDNGLLPFLLALISFTGFFYNS